ncbi:MAG: DUF3343 domain-containing protein [Spirochaetales bacterium]|nr:DUF3343 domain-containing protein [Spirochaetales bacterium]
MSNGQKLRIIIITFKSSHDAIASQDILTNRNLEFKVIPTPSELSSECGISLEIKAHSQLECMEALSEHSIRFACYPIS